MKYFEKSAPNKTAFITGAASGLGRALTLGLAKQNWQLGISDIDMVNLEVTKKLATQQGAQIEIYHLDVSKPDVFEEVSKEFLKKFKSIDLLINNAGIGAAGVFEDISIENWKQVISVNQMSVIYGCRNFIPSMKKQKGANIINISSAAAFSNAAAMAPYNVSKAAVLSLSNTLYAELKDFNIHVSVVMPTFFKTNIMQHVDDNSEGKELGQLMVATSGIEPETIAVKILKAATNKEFYIVLPFKAKLIRMIQRIMPNIFLRLNAFGYRKREKLQAYLRKKYEKQINS